MTSTLSWTFENKSYQKDDIVSAEFKVENFNQITAYQFAMLFDTTKLSFMGVEFPANNPLGLTANAFSWAGKPGYRVKANELRHLCSITNGKTLPNGTTVFSYVFKAKMAGSLKEDFSLSTCCLSPPLYPVGYSYPLIPVKLTVTNVDPQLNEN